MSYWIGFDLGGTKMQASVFDDKLKKIATERRKTKPQEGVDPTLDRILKTVQQVIQSAGIDEKEVTGMGIGVPGNLDLSTGTILQAPNLGWTNLPLSRTLRKALGFPVVVCNDVDAGVYGEFAAGSAKGGRCVLGVFVGTGIGGGLVYQDALFTGEKSSCMEIGHMPAVPDGPLCGCGKRGCLEAIAGRLAVSSAAAVAARRGQAPALLTEVGTDISKVRSSVLARSVGAGDTAVREILVDSARHIGKVVAATVNLLLPDIIVLGGGLVEALPELYKKEVRHGIAENVMVSYRKSYRLVTAKLGDDAAVTGAAAWARYSLSR